MKETDNMLIQIHENLKVTRIIFGHHGKKWM